MCPVGAWRLRPPSHRLLDFLTLTTVPRLRVRFVGMNILDANKFVEMHLVSHYSLCMDLLLAVAIGHEVVTWSERKKEFVSVGSDGETRELLPIDDEAIRSLVLENLTRAVKALTSIEDTASTTGQFLLRIGDHEIKVDVEGIGVNSPGTITLRMCGATEASDQARAILKEMMDEKNAMILSYDGERILGYGSLRLKDRMAELMEWAFVLVWYALWVGFACVLFAMTPLSSVLGILGWITCVLLGLCLALATAPHVFGRGDHE